MTPATAPTTPGTRNARTAATRAAITSAAERLFAERGVAAVSNRQVGEAAGQANNTAVAYHFGTKTDLIRAIIRNHAQDIEARRTPMLESVRGSADIRDWIRCLVLPSTEHFAVLGAPSWYARFNAQVMTDPALRALIYEDALASTSLQETLQGLRATAGAIPPRIRRTRADMARQLLVHMCSERERDLALAAAGTADPGQPHWAGAPADDHAGTWEELSADLVDALTGLWTAPVTR
ncbi:TetR/AcrR family transcriptional regulator [Tomitella gaofuii]|uniref:TetR/AcrR family transcriptional regulator n=1 Tax=Tomitella gaofuii TaxID=2760083 RepID=UPI0015FE48B2|nr:TetR/AcrR family transcriptional regulator [Tomitella gaofuii]